jgi:hypothetical protein
MRNITKKELNLVDYLKQHEKIVITDMADSRLRALNRLCDRCICRYELLDFAREDGHLYAEIVFTLE